MFLCIVFMMRDVHRHFTTAYKDTKKFSYLQIFRVENSKCRFFLFFGTGFVYDKMGRKIRLPTNRIIL